MNAPLPSPELLDAVQHLALERGWRLLQPFVCEGSESDHITELLRVADFPVGAHVLDVGCGFGECAKLMSEVRPDLVFTLVNFSELQLKECPPQFQQYLADAHALPFDDLSFDAVMFNASLCQMDSPVALAEASRVLKPGGRLLLNDYKRATGNNDELEAYTKSRAFTENDVLRAASCMGLDCTISSDALTRDYLREKMRACGEGDEYDRAFAGVSAGLWGFTKAKNTPVAAQYGALFYRHDNVALSLSGGKDSLACLYLFRAWWDRLTVYWLNPGDPFPETVELMDSVKKMVPHFVELAGRQKEIVAADGWPSDVVPQRHTTEGNAVFGTTAFKVQTRLQCCVRALMLPAYQQMLAGGVTCCIRGKREEEADKTGLTSGHVSPDGMELVFPLYDWAAADVAEYLTSEEVEVPPSYYYAKHSLDCMSCTAWWGEGLSVYLAAKHPERYTEYVRRLTLIKSAVADELNNCEV